MDGEFVFSSRASYTQGLIVQEHFFGLIGSPWASSLRFIDKGESLLVTSNSKWFMGWFGNKGLVLLDVTNKYLVSVAFIIVQSKAAVGQFKNLDV